MLRYLGVIGYPLKRSLSPAFQQAALEHNDTASVDVAFDDGVGLDFDAFRGGHCSLDSSADDDLFGLDITLNDARAPYDYLPRSANGPLNRSFDLERAGRFDITNDFQTGSDH